MSGKALFVGIEAHPGKVTETQDFLRQARPAIAEEASTTEWYALRFSETSFGIFDTFPGNAGRLKHLFGEVGRKLIVKTFTTFDRLPAIELADIVVSKRPDANAEPRFAVFGLLPVSWTLS